MVADYHFRAAKQGIDESFHDFATRLKVLASLASIPPDTINAQVLSVIRSTTSNHDTRMKCLDDNATLDSVLEWRRKHDVKDQCASEMDQKLAAPILAITTTTDKTCFSCGGPYPHSSMCPAKGKNCTKCGRLDHFEKVCRNGQPLFPRQHTNNIRQPPLNNRRPNNSTSNSYNNRRNNISDGRSISNNRSYQPYRRPNQAYEPSNNRNVRQISELSEQELIDKFEAFYRDEQLKEDNSVVRSIGSHIELINELSTTALARCPRSYVKIGDRKVQHLIDTGTNLNILSRSTYFNLNKRPLLRHTSIRAFGFTSKTAIPLLGEFTSNIKFRHRIIPTRYIVLDGEADNILGYTAATLLGIVRISCDENPQDIQDDRYTINSVSEFLNHPFKTHPTLFSGKLGTLKNHLVHMKVDPNAIPCQQHAYKVPLGLYDLTKGKLDWLESQGIISKATIEQPLWISPCHPVAKINEVTKEITGVRITSNSKQLNKHLIPQKRYIPSIPELTGQLAGCEWFSKLDFNDAFNQLVFDDSSRILTAMSTVWGIYYWNRMNMGISIASELFQEAMQKLLGHIPGVTIALDDIMIASKTKGAAQESLKACLDQILDSGMSLNKDKCEFLQPEITFFGVTISKEGIKPKKSKLEDLIRCEEPKDSKGVQSFLGLTGYFKNRSPYQSTIDKPLRNLIKNGVPFKWNSDEQNSYRKLKDTVIQEAMAFFDHKKETELYVDAGPDGCSSFLTQIDKLGEIRLVRCDSHAFSPAESRYSHIEKEAFACVWACKTNHLYLYGRHFKLITDALSVKKIFQEDKIRKRTPIRFIRWRSDLSVYNCEIIHREGSKNIADYLSRHFKRNIKDSNIMSLATISLEKSINNIVDACKPSCITLERLISATLEDTQITEVKKALHSSKPRHYFPVNKIFRNIFEELSITSDGILLRNDVIVIPSGLQKEIIVYAHEGHNGKQLCKRLLRNICWFAHMDSQIDKEIDNCVPCQCNENTIHPSPISPTTIPPTAWHTLAIDFSSRLPTGEYTLAIYDENSRYTMAKLASNMTSKTAIDICKNFFRHHGIPKEIKSDNGPAFISVEWANFIKQFNVKHKKVTPYHPEANASAERVMKGINKRARCAAVANTNWKSEYSAYLHRYNQTPHSATNISPNMLLLGSDECDILPQIVKRTLNNAMRERAIINDTKAKSRMKAYADRYQLTKQRTFEINDPVLHLWIRTNKHQPLFDPHPYRIKTMKHEMLTASRSNHSLTRNSKKFKQISTNNKSLVSFSHFYGRKNKKR